MANKEEPNGLFDSFMSVRIDTDTQSLADSSFLLLVS